MQVGCKAHVTLPLQYRSTSLKEIHHLTNTGQDKPVLIEVQCGSYLDRDDTVTPLLSCVQTAGLPQAIASS